MKAANFLKKGSKILGVTQELIYVQTKYGGKKEASSECT